MQKSYIKVAVVCFVAIIVGSCKHGVQSAQTNPRCPPLMQLATIRPLACYIDDNHLLGVGNASSTAVPKDTVVSFVAKLENAGAYCATVSLPKPIPPHLFILITGQPLFDNSAPCQAWREVPPTSEQ